MLAERKRCSVLKSSYNICDFLSSRENGLRSPFHFHFENKSDIDYLIRRKLLRETPIYLGHHQTVFCSKWLSNREVVFGTKCNKLLLYDVNNKNVRNITMISGNRASYSSFEDAVRAIDINPDRTYLATNARSSADIAIYRVPNLSPVCVGETAHHDSITDLCWINNNFVMSGGNDANIAIWRIDESIVTNSSNSAQIAYNLVPTVDPYDVKSCRFANQISSVCFNRQQNEIVALSTNGYINIFNADTFMHKKVHKMPYCRDSVSIVHHNNGYYAVGCCLHVKLLDSRSLQPIKKITSRYGGCGMRALSFADNMLTIGTGLGMVIFYDTRAGKFIESNANNLPSGVACLKCSKGIAYSDEYIDTFDQDKYTPTIYTHCYDSTKTRLFTAGGPLPSWSALFGNYAGLWQ